MTRNRRSITQERQPDLGFKETKTMTKEPGRKVININPFFGKVKMKLEIEHDPCKTLPHDHIWIISSTGQRLCYLHLDDSFLSIERTKAENTYLNFGTGIMSSKAGLIPRPEEQNQ